MRSQGISARIFLSPKFEIKSFDFQNILKSESDSDSSTTLRIKMAYQSDVHIRLYFMKYRPVSIADFPIQILE